ncbi:OapC/ArvC family zinc-ribbon domain-containing protein [Natrinema salifodinae]|uniref:Zn-ribbon containing protein n=1 Tax=Natrinema salifodinae TaxID=1202768 RepID=A0A1I0QFV5_9EURY|nr:Zn-ribbon containing protein [Natrinema salifodinae]SEW25984.1 hypothetical protein SAMN05216285_3524 [Natrinema salifodinae]
MPHQCTNCGRTFADGSKEMLSGCPDCGGNKFQFAPSATTGDSFDGTGGSGSTDTGTAVDSSSDTDTANSDGVASRAAETVRDWVSTGSSDSSTASSDPADQETFEPERRSEPGSASERADRVETDGATATQSNANAQSTTAWPATASPSPDPASDEESDGEFAEWPETARRPEERSDATDATVTSEPPVEPDNDDAPDRTASPAADRDQSQTRATLADDENAAQADARTEVVTRDDLPPAADPDGDGPPGDAQPPGEGRVVSEPSGEQPSIEELREELNEQFESIRIVQPGQYELNLMELYNREEYIVSLQEDGRYVIDVPDSWRDGDDE